MIDVFPFLIAFLVTCAAIPITIKIAKKYSLVDDPKKRPHPAHIQQRVIPRAGGLAIYLGIVITTLLLLPIKKYLIGTLLGITVLLIIGLLDDKFRNFNPYIRLSLLFLAAGCAVASGIGVSFIANPLQVGSYIRLDQITIPFQFFGPHQIIPIADIFAFFLIIALTQVINWSKGVDGQMPGITFIASLTMAILSTKLFFQGDIHQLTVAKLGFITAGTSLAFLLFNWHPSKILPGFSGSTISAFMLAILSILSGAKVATMLLVLAIPALDFIYTIVRRIAHGKSPVWGDRGHLHHLLLDRKGWSQERIALFYIAISAILGLVSLFIDTTSKFFAILGVSILFIGFILWLNSFGPFFGRSDQDNG